MATSKVRLNICGSSYVIATSESEDYMQNLADRLNLDMNELMSSSKSVSITTVPSPSSCSTSRLPRFIGPLLSNTPHPASCTL